MTLLRNGLVRPFLIVILLVVVILIILNIYLSGKIRQLAPVYIDRYSKLSGLALSADEAGLDPLFRIRLNGVKAADPALPQKDLAEIGDEIKAKLEIQPASRMEDVLKVALQRVPQPLVLEDEVPAAVPASSTEESGRVTH